MNRWKRLLSFLVLNVIVTAMTMWVVLTLWSRANGLPTEPAAVAGSPAGAAAAATQPASLSAGVMEIRAVIAAGDLNSERVNLLYLGAGELSLEGWQLEDEDGHVYVFPDLRMFSDGAVTVRTRVGTDTPLELHWGLDAPVWSAGERALLRDPAGDVQAEYVIP